MYPCVSVDIKSHMFEMGDLLLSTVNSKLALGSANFGLDYGIANKVGKISHNSVTEILKVSKISGVKFVDTAQAYGSSEAILGEHNLSNLNIISKIGRLGSKSGEFTVDLLRKLNTSLDRLNVTSLYGLLLHAPDEVLEKNGTEIIEAMRVAKELGLVHQIGVSIYNPLILDQIYQYWVPDMVQCAFNVFDQRMITSGWADRLKGNGTEVHVRSVFLQGLLLLKEEQIPEKFQNFKCGSLSAWFDLQKKMGLRAEELALQYALSQPWIDKVVVGVDSASQLEKLKYIEMNMKSLDCDFSLLKIDDERLIDPSNW